MMGVLVGLKAFAAAVVGGIGSVGGAVLGGLLTGKKNTIYNFRASVCLETQKYPDTPNKADWPTAVVRPGEKYQSHCIYKFSVHK
jgi:aldose 1-epimerase